MKICMFVKNSFEFDARVEKEARSLVGAGHDVTVIALLVPGVTPEREVTEVGVRVIRVRSVDFGINRLAQSAGRRARLAVMRRARAQGVDVDDEEMDRVTQLVPPMTARPGINSRGWDDHVPDDGAGGTGLWSGLGSRIVLGWTALLRHGLRLAIWVLGVPAVALRGSIESQRMRKVGTAIDADVYHAHDRNTLWVGVQCSRAQDAFLVYDAHELAAGRSGMGPLSRRWAAWTECRWMRVVDALIVVSPGWIDLLRGRYGSLPEIAVPILNCAQQKEITPVDLHELLELPAGMPLLLYQGTIQENRGLEPAIEALEILGDFGLVVLGWGHHRPVVEEFAQQRDVASRVRFAGPVPGRDLLNHTAGATIGLCNIVGASLSYHTALPNKLFEYVMAGVPIIGSSGPEIARILEETGAGIAVEAEDPKAIAVAARKILSELDDFRTAAERAARLYNWGIEEEKLVDLYRSLSRGESIGEKGS